MFLAYNNFIEHTNSWAGERAMNFPRTGSLYFLNSSRLYMNNVGIRTVAYEK